MQVWETHSHVRNIKVLLCMYEVGLKCSLLLLHIKLILICISSVLLSKGQSMLLLVWVDNVIAQVLKGCIVKFHIICSQSEWWPSELLIAASICLNALCAQYCTFILNFIFQFTEQSRTQHPEDMSSVWNSG